MESGFAFRILVTVQYPHLTSPIELTVGQYFAGQSEEQKAYYHA